MTSQAHRIDRRGLVKGLAGLGLATTALGVGVASQSVANAQDRGKQGGTVVIGVYQEPNSLNFLLTGGPISFSSMQLYAMFEPLIRYNAEGTMEPRLLTEIPTVENGGISEDGITYTLHFTPDVIWHDGTPRTATEFKCTWQWSKAPKSPGRSPPTRPDPCRRPRSRRWPTTAGCAATRSGAATRRRGRRSTGS